MDKATEIAFILNDDTYLACIYFSRKDREIMAENIRNDFPIMLNTAWEETLIRKDLAKKIAAYDGGMP